MTERRKQIFALVPMALFVVVAVAWFYTIAAAVEGVPFKADIFDQKSENGEMQWRNIESLSLTELIGLEGPTKLRITLDNQGENKNFIVSH